MTDLVQRLRANAMAIAPNPNDPSNVVQWQAADRIEKLEAILRKISKWQGFRGADAFYEHQPVREFARHALDDK